MLKVANVLKKLKTSQEANETMVTETTQCEDEFETSLQNECQVTTAAADPDQVGLKLKLINLSNLKHRLPNTTDVVKYWEARKHEDPELYELAMIALSVPVTQVSVERCFSVLKLLLENHRLRMAEARLDDLMVIRCNRELIGLAIQALRTSPK